MRCPIMHQSPSMWKRRVSMVVGSMLATRRFPLVTRQMDTDSLSAGTMELQVHENK